MTPQEVVGHPDFTNIVKFAISKYKLNFKESFDDSAQNIALNILRYGTGDNLSLCTVIIKQTIWEMRRQKSDKIRINCQFLVDQKSIENNNINHVDNVDQMEEILAVITEKQKEVLQLMLDGKTQEEIAQKFACTKQNVSLFINSARKKIQREKLDAAIC